MIKRLAGMFVVCVWTLAFAGIVRADAAAVQRAFEKHMADNKVVGGSVAIIKDGKVLYEDGYGWQDREAKIKATSSTVYRLASMSKSVTAVAAMQLVESGKMSLFAPAQRYAPAFPKKNHTITLRHLLAHTSGIRGRRSSDSDYGGERTEKTSDAIQKFADDDLLFEPGTRFRYGPHGYTLVALMIEGASGMSFEEYLSRNVFARAGLSSFGLERREVRKPDRAQIYHREEDNAALIPEATLSNSWNYASGGMESSATDMARFGDAVLNGRLLRKETADFMWTLQSFGEFDSGNALGWGVLSDGRPISGGAMLGGISFLMVNRETRVVYSVMTNTSGHDHTPLIKAVVAAWDE